MSKKDLRDQDSRGQEDRLLDLLEKLPDDILEEAAGTEDRQTYRKLAAEKEKQPPYWSGFHWKRYGLLAACLCVTVILGTLWQTGLPQDGSMAEKEESGLTDGAASGENGAPLSQGSGGKNPVSDGEQTDGFGISTEAEQPDADNEQACSGFYYEGNLYIVADAAITEKLPEGFYRIGVIYQAPSGEPEVLKTVEPDSEGCQVYGSDSDDGGLYVAVKGGYRWYLPGMGQ